jgi:biotin carboxyl carrier protein
MPSSLRESSSPAAAPDQNRTVRPVVSTRAPFVDKTSSPVGSSLPSSALDSPASTPALREKRERGESRPNRTSAGTVAPALWASVPALLLLGLGAAMRDNGLPRPLAGGDFEATGRRGSDSLIVSGQGAVVPQSQTLVVPTGASAAPIVWQSRLLAVSGVTGRAPIDGQITRVYVHEGQSVEVGDRVLRIASSRQVMPEEPDQSSLLLPADGSHPSRRAERAQVQASQAKNALQVKMESAQQQLVAAQERVAQAKTRIVRTTEIVRKLQAGMTDESSTRLGDDVANAANAETANEDSTDSRPAKDGAAQQAAMQKRAAALRETQDVERKASRAESRAAAAQKRAESQGEAARDLAQKARDLRAQRARELRQQQSDEENQPAADEPLARSSASASASDGTGNEVTKATPKPAARPVRKVSVSQNTVEAAQSRAQSAASLASSASDKAQNLATDAARARAAANTSSERASRLMSQLQLFGDDSTPSKSVVKHRKNKPRVRSVKRPGDLPSIGQAARMVQAATEESAAAQSEARRLKAQVDSYSQQAQETRHDLDASSNALEASQQTLQRSQQQTLDRTLIANLSVVRAPSSGTILWVAPVADDVSSGEPIIRMGRRGALQARFVDRSGLWRNLKPDMLLPARVSEASDESATLPAPLSLPKPVDSSTRLPLAAREKSHARDAAASSRGSSGSPNGGIAATVRVQSVTPPEHDGEPAIVRVAVFSAPSQKTGATLGQRRLRSGMTVSCLFPRPNRKSVSLPRTAILSGDAVAPALLTSKPFLREAQQPASDANQDNDATATASNNGATIGVVRGANGEAAPNGANSAFGVNGAESSAANANAANASTNVPANASTNVGWIAVLRPLNGNQELHRIEWRRVVLGGGQNAMQSVVEGLQPGERVALRPALLWTYSQSYGADATIRLSRRL